ncbi:MAG TPA: glycosyltransferase family 2 protein [bacterium]|nr:glycosyltransferase family 2 protein [bacterium]HPP30085.1 glycosyltransferase family 2 protein [bacterium]
MTEKLKNISVVLPAYNEEENIADAIINTRNTLGTLADNYEIIVVNDGSTDRTGEIAEHFAQQEPSHTRIFHHSSNKGYGAALRTGFLNTRYEYVFYTDADNQFDISELRNFLPLIEKYDIIIGYRIKRKDSLLRIFLSKGYNYLVFLLFHLKVRDVDCSFKLFHKYVLDAIKIECDDFFVDTEILVRAKKAGFHILEKGVTHYPRKRGKTTVRPGHILKTLITITKLWKQIHRKNKYNE